MREINIRLAGTRKHYSPMLYIAGELPYDAGGERNTEYRRHFLEFLEDRDEVFGIHGARNRTRLGRKEPRMDEGCILGDTTCWLSESLIKISLGTGKKAKWGAGEANARSSTTDGDRIGRNSKRRKQNRHKVWLGHLSAGRVNSSMKTRRSG